MLSVINVGLALGAQKLTNSQASTSVTATTSATTGPTTTTSSTATPTDTAVQSGLSTLGDTTKQITQDALKIAPTITIDQGTLMKVFVNQDLVFPANVAQNLQVIQ